MQALRSIIFNLIWPVNLALQMIVQSPVYFFAMNHAQRVMVPKRWARSSHWFQRVIVGAKMEVLGKEHIPEGAALIASKHQSNWDFYALYEKLPDAAFVLKSELMKIPFFGWYVAALDHIPINRGDRGKAMRAMTVRAKEELAKGKQIMIFPEGTRTLPEAEPAYRYGITRMYLELGVPVVPVALNSGLYWERRSFMRHAGTVRMKFMPPIPAGLDGDEFAARLQASIEQGMADIYRLTLEDDVRPPMPQAVIEQAKA